MTGDGTLTRATAATGVLLEPTGKVLGDSGSKLPLRSPDVGASTPTLKLVNDMGATGGRHAVLKRADPDRLAPEDDSRFGCGKCGFGCCPKLSTEVVGSTVTKEG